MCKEKASEKKSWPSLATQHNAVTNSRKEMNANSLFSRPMPHNATDPEAADSLIASEMAKISVDDREKVYMDVHGISDYVAETSELVEQSLIKLEHEIELLRDKPAYELAKKSDPAYVKNREFRLAFLRCEKFDCAKAAKRMILHFQMKLDLFGEDKIAMDITQDDLDAEDIEAVYSCSGRFLNAFDSGGRIVNLLVQMPRKLRTLSLLRRGFYNIMLAFRDVEVQMRGAIILWWGVGEVRGNAESNDGNWKLSMLNDGTPMRVLACHFCYTDEVWRAQFAVAMRGLNTSTQLRVRVHHGTVNQIMHELRGYGIDPESIPLNEKGEIKDISEHCRRMEEQRAKERLTYPRRRIIGVASAQDVLLGKGTPYQDHPGNKHLRHIVSERYLEWENAPKGEKKDLAEGVIDTIHGLGGLFLKQDGDNNWMPVDRQVARLKVSAAFRTLRLKGGTN